VTVNIRGTICYGIKVNEVPWESYKEDDWWMYETGFKPQMRELFDSEGTYRIDINKDAQAYFKERRDWKDAHPLPFIVVNVGHLEDPVFILAVPSSITTVYLGEPTRDYNKSISADENERLGDFEREYEIDGEWGWWLGIYSDH
jgi:hypothetical protein